MINEGLIKLRILQEHDEYCLVDVDKYFNC